ncbi:conserved hypothetical protein [Flavobacterium sp. 9AF]|uniref:hypothetical protein n=1 Tax=Flavobacterium sp. 9AF TaxID=2653142 RepID=UPI0012F1FDCF|nr:hypothetical protein [Flavobacterium sp. 9AF]VXC01365.1 conserved hypothetical protein [Flavobacterium sp. 9AF]
MKPKYKKYKIKKNDTLESIANKLEKSIHEIKSFHNVFCDSDSYIGVSLPNHLKELYIYPEFNEKELSLLQKVFTNDNYKLSQTPSNNTLNYGVMYTIYSGKEKNSIKFEVEVQYLEKKNEDNLLFLVNKKSITYINDEEVNTIADELAVKTSSVLYPLELVITNEGNWIAIHNYETIYKRWEKIKEAILDEYEGEWVEKYLNLNEKTLADENLLFDSLKKDWFLASYFNTVFVYYSHKYRFNTKISFPILPNCKAVEYDIEQKINEFIETNDTIRIEQNGELKDERSKLDLENNLNVPYYGALYPDYNKAKGNYRSVYLINAKTKVIESLFLECSVELDIEKKTQIVVSVL